MEFLRDSIKYIVVIVLVILLKIYIISPGQVMEESMEPTLYQNDIILLEKVTYMFKDVERFDIVVLSYPDQKFVVKRIIGLPGETIEYKNNELLVNNEVVEEVFLTENTEDYGPVTVPEGKYFVVGDNRDVSIDSRSNSVGFISEDDILGKNLLVIWPFSSFGVKK